MICTFCGKEMSDNGFIKLTNVVKENGLYFVVCPVCGEKNHWKAMQELSNGEEQLAMEA